MKTYIIYYEIQATRGTTMRLNKKMQARNIIELYKKFSIQYRNGYIIQLKEEVGNA